MISKIYVETLGCKINQYETACVLDEFINNGFIETKFIEQADIIIINTCTVTNRTDYKSRSLITKAENIKRAKPDLNIIVTGCYAQNNRDTILSSGYIDLVVDNNNKNLIYDYIKNNQHSELCKVNTFDTPQQFSGFSEMSMDMMHDRNRAFLKIQDGCDFHCSYCVVPSVRGNPRSRSFESITRQVETLLDNGYEEIVLGGINLGLYGIDSRDAFEKGNRRDLADLLIELTKHEKLKQIRLSSIEPQLFTDKLLSVINSIDKISPHFHIPLQTGSDYMLNLHNKKYTSQQFSKLVNKLRDIKPQCALGFDVIVGLPEESDAYFQETYDLLNSIDFTYLHIFNYSKRQGTLATTMKNQIHGSIMKERSQKLQGLLLTKKEDYIKRLIDERIVLVGVPERYDEKKELWSSTSDRYIKGYYKFEVRNSEFGMKNRKTLKLMPIKKHYDGVFCEVLTSPY